MRQPLQIQIIQKFPLSLKKNYVFFRLRR
jgi:hypothetical protein